MGKKTHRIDLNEFVKTINKINNAKSFVMISEIIFDFTKELFRYDLAVFYSVNEATNQLEVISCRGTNVSNLKSRLRFNIGDGSVGWVAKTQKALLIEDVLDYEEEEIKVRLHKQDPEIRSFFAVPLIVDNITIGVLSVSCSKPSSFDENIVEMITILASQAAVFLELNKKYNAVEQFKNRVLENVNSAVVAINNDEKIVVFNKKAVSTTGYLLKNMIGEDVGFLKIRCKSDKMDSERKMFLNEELLEESGWITDVNGNQISIILSTTILCDEEGNLSGRIIIFRDNTIVELLQDQVVQSEKLAVIGRMTSGILHEIRNPLLPIRSSAQMLLSKTEEDGFSDNHKRLIRIIYEESERLNGFLRTLEGFRRIEKQNWASPLFSTLSDIMLICKQDFEKNKIVASIHSDVDCEVFVPFSKDKFKQILLNLIINSIDAILEHNGEDRRITVEISELMEKVRIRVIDTGVGIEVENTRKILDPFYTTKEKGTGLGLSIVFQLINCQNGTIEFIESESGGTCAELILPILSGGEKFESK